VSHRLDLGLVGSDGKTISCIGMIQDIVAYLPHVRTAEPQKQAFISKTRTQQKNKGVMQPSSRQRLGKHTFAQAQLRRTPTVVRYHVICFPSGPHQANARNNRTSVARQRSCKQAFLTKEDDLFRGARTEELS
jgi:hypothetical protein